MVLSDKNIALIKLGFSIMLLLYLFFLLMVLPILPIENAIFEIITPPSYILLFCGLFGLIFIGSLSIFTLAVMWKGSSNMIK